MRFILLPISILYGIAVFIRNLFYDTGLLPAKKFKIPVISVGNLTVGGTGKTPHIEYLIRLLSPEYHPSVLMRGYKRKTSGFIIGDGQSTVDDIGDEACQMKKKFPKTGIAVCGNRVTGIKKIMEQLPDVNVILLDDAFQHRSVQPGLSVLLTEYKKLTEPQWLLPAGDLREWPYGQKRADIIIVSKTPPLSKTPPQFSPQERRRITRELKPRSYQKVYFSFLSYGDFLPVFAPVHGIPEKKDEFFAKRYSVLLVSGIADSSYMVDYLSDKVPEIIPFDFPDHHTYAEPDVKKILKVFDNIVNPHKIILTTEKDAVRMKDPVISRALNDRPVYCIPVEIVFHGEDTADFNRQILDYVRTHQRHMRVHSK